MLPVEPATRCSAVDEAYPRYTPLMLQRQPACDCPASVVADDESSLDAQRVEQPNYPTAMASNRIVRSSRRITAPKTEKVDDQHAMALRQLWHDLQPDVTRRR